MRNVIITGPPGAGKGTQASKIQDAFNLIHISTGAILRNEVESGSELGKQVKDAMERGELVSDQLVIDIVSKTIASQKGAAGFLFDGFPRTQQQALALDKILDEHGSGISVVVNLEVPEDVLIDRVLGREDSRADDNIDILKERLRVYREDTFPLIDHYKKDGKLREVDGNQPPNQVFASIQKVFELVS